MSSVVGHAAVDDHCLEGPSWRSLRILSLTPSQSCFNRLGDTLSTKRQLDHPGGTTVTRATPSANQSRAKITP
jgi:hypothetical protein